MEIASKSAPQQMVTSYAGAPQAASFAYRAAWPTLVVLSVAYDFSMVPILVTSSGPTLPVVVTVFGALGCTLAQGNLLAAWLVWSEGAFSRRLAVHWAIAAALCCIWLAGVMLSAAHTQFVEVGVTVALTVPLVSLAAQLPLWIVRHFFRWRLVRPAAEMSVGTESPLTIRDLMLATLLAAAAFGLARLSPANQRAQQFWIAWFIAFVLASGISTIAMLPAGVLLMRRRPLKRALVYSGLYAALLVGTLWVVVAILRWRAPSVLAPWFVYVGLSSLMLSFASTLVLAAVAARAKGYQLVWGRRPL